MSCPPGLGKSRLTHCVSPTPVLASSSGPACGTPAGRYGPGLMRRPTLLLLGFIFAALPLGAEVPPLLQEALKKFSAEVPYWAYTETVVRTDMKGKPEGETIVQIDPSKPYAEQILPLKIDGKKPTPSEIEKFRKDRQRRQDREENQSLGRLILPDQTKVVAETATSVTYEVGLRRTGNSRLPPDKFQVLVRIDKARQELENVTVRIRESFRVALVAKVKSGTATLNFRSVLPDHPAPLEMIKAEGAGSVLFVKLGANYELRRTEFRRVKPYSDNFKATIGDLKVLDF
jgi:hypothetical protein